MNVKSDKFYVNGQTSSNSNLNSRWNYVIKVGCFKIIVLCVEHIHGILFFSFLEFLGNHNFFGNLGPEWPENRPFSC